MALARASHVLVPGLMLVSRFIPWLESMRSDPRYEEILRRTRRLMSQNVAKTSWDGARVAPRNDVDEFS